MQSTLSRNEVPVESGDTRIFPLKGILPDGDAFVIKIGQGSVSHFSHDTKGNPCIKAHLTLSANEIAVLVQLLESFPFYAPYECIYAAFYYGLTYTEKQVNQVRKDMRSWLDTNVWSYKTRQVRRCLSRVRVAIKPYGFRVRSIIETGYLLEKPKETPVNPHIQHFDLEMVLPPGTRLAFAPEEMLLLLDKQGVRVVERFAPGEISLIKRLLSAYPHYCPSAVLLANLNREEDASEEEVKAARKTLNEALLQGIWSTPMGPVRNLLSRTRPRLARLGLEVSSLVETGYMLMSHPKGENRTEEGRPA